jgi:hypothetical protein
MEFPAASNVDATAAPTQPSRMAKDDKYIFEAAIDQRVVQVLEVLKNDAGRILKISGTTTRPGNRGRIAVIRQGAALRYVLPRYVEAFRTVRDVFT